VKEALFNILAVLLANFEGCRVLDLFAGTGNLGIEALSRGAELAIFIDKNSASAALVKENLELTGLSERGQILQREAMVALKLLEKSAAPFSLVFLDPPYREGLSVKALEVLSMSSLIDEESIIVAETDPKEEIAPLFSRLKMFDRRIYGDTALSFFALAGEPGEQSA
jgi:16S rRNA (guanine(966)-N(2))-methyltransferase RsmD